MFRIRFLRRVIPACANTNHLKSRFRRGEMGNGLFNFFFFLTKQPLAPANCMHLISAGFSSHVRRLPVSILLRLSFFFFKTFSFLSVLIYSLRSVSRCPAGIVKQLSTQTSNLPSQSWSYPNTLFFY